MHHRDGGLLHILAQRPQRELAREQPAGSLIEEHVPRGDEKQLAIAPDEKARTAAPIHEDLHGVGEVVLRKIRLRGGEAGKGRHREEGNRQDQGVPSCHGAI